MTYIFEDEQHGTLFETNYFSEIRYYLYHFSNTLEFSDMYESMNYITIHFYGYNLMIKKNVINFENNLTE